MSSQNQNASKELETLRILRATLESVKQLVDGIGTDIQGTTRNVENVTELSQRWQEALKETREALKNVQQKGTGAGAGSAVDATENAEVALVDTGSK